MKSDPALMKEFLAKSGGVRDVPLIVDGGRVTTGFGGA